MDLPEHWMKNFFLASFASEKLKYDMSIEMNYGLLCFFSKSSYIID
jgi:hypothetical protein